MHGGRQTGDDDRDELERKCDLVGRGGVGDLDDGDVPDAGCEEHEEGWPGNAVVGPSHSARCVGMQRSQATEQSGQGDLPSYPDGGSQDMEEDANGRQTGGEHEGSLSVGQCGQHIAGLELAIIKAAGSATEQHGRTEVDGVL
jgi:hypothetical protein